MKCALCGYEFDETGLACHTRCPLADGCAIVCCPHCGYQVVDETKSDMVSLARKIQALFSRRRKEQETVGAGNLIPLCDLPPGRTAEVAQIQTQDDGRLLRLSALGLVPGSRIRLQQRYPAYVVWVGETQLSLDRDVAQDIILHSGRRTETIEADYARLGPPTEKLENGES